MLYQLVRTKRCFSRFHWKGSTGCWSEHLPRSFMVGLHWVQIPQLDHLIRAASSSCRPTTHPAKKPNARLYFPAPVALVWLELSRATRWLVRLAVPTVRSLQLSCSLVAGCLKVEDLVINLDIKKIIQVHRNGSEIVSSSSEFSECWVSFIFSRQVPAFF